MSFFHTKSSKSSVYVPLTSQFTPATFQGFSGHMWLVTALPDHAALHLLAGEVCSALVPRLVRGFSKLIVSKRQGTNQCCACLQECHLRSVV